MPPMPYHQSRPTRQPGSVSRRPLNSAWISSVEGSRSAPRRALARAEGYQVPVRGALGKSAKTPWPRPGPEPRARGAGEGVDLGGDGDRDGRRQPVGPVGRGGLERVQALLAERGAGVAGHGRDRGGVVEALARVAPLTTVMVAAPAWAAPARRRVPRRRGRIMASFSLRGRDDSLLGHGEALAQPDLEGAVRQGYDGWSLAALLDGLAREWRPRPKGPRSAPGSAR